MGIDKVSLKLDVESPGAGVYGLRGIGNVSFKLGVESPGAGVYDLPKLSKTSEDKSDAERSDSYEEFLKVVNTPGTQYEISMYTADEISAAVSAQDWEKLGHAESVLVAATNDRDIDLLDS